jgi:S-DNA-T family DNA segregation ATPase FtsK/SpoIIIE
VHAGVHAVLLAPEHSRACADARAHGVLVVTPSQPRGDLPAQVQLVLVDDAEAFAGTPAEDALLALLLDASAGSAFLVAASNADVAVAHRGIVAEVRRSRTGLALCPRPSDGEPFGVRLPRRNTELAPGRGVLIGGARAGAHLGTAPVRIQVAMPDEIRTCAGIGDRSAERKSP